MSDELPGLPPIAAAISAAGEEPRASRRHLVLSTRTATQASHGALLDRLLDLRRPSDGAMSDAHARPRPWSASDAPPDGPVAHTVAPSAPSPAARDAVCLAAQAYVRLLVRDGTAGAAALEAVRAAVREGAAFLSAPRLAALERRVLRAARAVC